MIVFIPVRTVNRTHLQLGTRVSWANSSSPRLLPSFQAALWIPEVEDPCQVSGPFPLLNCFLGFYATSGLAWWHLSRVHPLRGTLGTAERTPCHSFHSLGRCAENARDNVLFCLVLVWLGIGLMTSHLLGRCCATELCPQPKTTFILKGNSDSLFIRKIPFLW